MNGRKLADEAQRRRPDIKVLYTTGYTRNAIVHNGILDADVAFLAKPFTFEQLALKVRQVLDGAGATGRDEYRSSQRPSGGRTYNVAMQQIAASCVI